MRLQNINNTSQREKKNDFQIKDEIQYTNNIINNIKFKTRITHRFQTTFISRQFIFRSFSITDPKTNKIQRKTDLQQNDIYIKDSHINKKRY